MRMNLLAFGVARDILGGSSATVDLNEDATVADLKIILKEQYPALKKLSSFAIACNNEYADDRDIVSAGDELAIIPPVSGG